MTLVSSIILDAYRESNLIAIAASPTTAETAEALRLLNRLFSSVFGEDIGEHLIDTPVGSGNYVRPSGYPDYNPTPSGEYVVPENSRLITNLTAATTVYLSPNPRDGARLGITDPGGNLATYSLTLSGNGRQIETTNTVTLNTNGLDREWFYRADLGAWQRLTSLVSGDTFPFPEKYDDMFITLLSTRLNPRHAVQANDQSMMMLKRGMKQFKAQYRQTREVGSDTALVRLPLTWRERGQAFPNDDFNVGRP